MHVMILYVHLENTNCEGAVFLVQQERMAFLSKLVHGHL